MAAVFRPPTLDHLTSGYGPDALQQMTTATMAYHYHSHSSLPLNDGADVGFPPSEYLPSYGATVPGHTASSSIDGPPSHEASPLEGRRESSSQADKELKRSVSSPNVRPHTSNPSDPQQMGLPGEKKKNKLGYHRTSVACGEYHATAYAGRLEGLAQTKLNIALQVTAGDARYGVSPLPLTRRADVLTASALRRSAAFIPSTNHLRQMHHVPKPHHGLPPPAPRLPRLRHLPPSLLSHIQGLGRPQIPNWPTWP